MITLHPLSGATVHRNAIGALEQAKVLDAVQVQDDVFMRRAYHSKILFRAKAKDKQIDFGWGQARGLPNRPDKGGMSLLVHVGAGWPCSCGAAEG